MGRPEIRFHSAACASELFYRDNLFVGIGAQALTYPGGVDNAPFMSPHQHSAEVAIHLSSVLCYVCLLCVEVDNEFGISRVFCFGRRISRTIA